MNHKIVTGMLLASLSLAACSNENASQLVVLYRGEVASGNSIVSFINHNDPTGQFASKHCEELKAVYAVKEHLPFICSTVIFPEFKPVIK